LLSCGLRRRRPRALVAVPGWTVTGPLHAHDSCVCASFSLVFLSAAGPRAGRALVLIPTPQASRTASAPTRTSRLAASTCATPRVVPGGHRQTGARLWLRTHVGFPHPGRGRAHLQTFGRPNGAPSSQPARASAACTKKYTVKVDPRSILLDAVVPQIRAGALCTAPGHPGRTCGPRRAHERSPEPFLISASAEDLRAGSDGLRREPAKAVVVVMNADQILSSFPVR
jgi:hypothetical protein